MADIIRSICSYLNTQKNYLDTKPQIVIGNTYTCINFIFQGKDIEVCIYNDSFIKLKVDNITHAICDGINTFKYEIDRLYTLRYQ